MKSYIPPEIEHKLGTLLGKSTSIALLAKGGNSSVWNYRVSNQSYAVKLYPIEDKSLRIENEFAALTWLRKSDFFLVPAAIFKDERHRFAVYELLPGNKVPAEGVTDSHIKQYFDLFRSLKRLSRTDSTPQFRSAKEACFDIQSHIELIDKRFITLRETPWKNVAIYCNERIAPLWNILKKRLQVRQPCNHLVMPHERILSPSDVGFHNTLEGDSGLLHFFDFEYFGWDDPIKFLADFTLQPQYDLPITKLIPHLQRLLADETNGKIRYLNMLQLLNIKWSLIFLNPALRDYKCISQEGDLAQLLEVRLERVEQRLIRFDTILNTLEHSI
tara:strand:- start:1422 stop:2411 length:990 start_codon:yes stop_codon:yes gene_type:complete